MNRHGILRHMIIEECYHNRCKNRKMNNNDTDADTVVHGSSNQNIKITQCNHNHSNKNFVKNNNDKNNNNYRSNKSNDNYRHHHATYRHSSQSISE